MVTLLSKMVIGLVQLVGTAVGFQVGERASLFAALGRDSAAFHRVMCLLKLSGALGLPKGGA